MLAKRKEVEGMSEKQLHAHLEEWSDKSYGQEWGGGIVLAHYPVVPSNSPVCRFW